MPNLSMGWLFMVAAILGGVVFAWWRAGGRVAQAKRLVRAPAMIRIDSRPRDSLLRNHIPK